MTRYKNKQTYREKRLAVRRWMVGTSFKVGLIVTMAVFGVLYITQMSSVSTKGFTISDLQKQVQTLEHETMSLEVEISEYRSMSSIQERLENMDLVAAGEVGYVTPVGAAVARR